MKKAGIQRARRTSPRNVRKLGVTGTYTYYLTLPKAMVEELGWREGQKVVVRKSGDRIIIEDWKG